jgi:hypothetical protein
MTIADPIITIFYSITVYLKSKEVIINCLIVLMEGSPEEINSK